MLDKVVAAQLASGAIDGLSQIPCDDFEVEGPVQRGIGLVEGALHQLAHSIIFDGAVRKQLALNKVAQIFVKVVALFGGGESEASLEVCELLFLILLEEGAHIVGVQQGLVAIGGLLKQTCNLTRI